jgi:hypothetical protein
MQTRTFPRAPVPVLITAIAIALVAIPLSVRPAVGLPPLPAQAQGTIGSGTGQIGFSGHVLITPRIIEDPDFRTPTVLELIIDFSNVKGVASSNGRRFVSDSQTIVRRPLLAFDAIEVTFPYAPVGEAHSARTAKASLGVSFSVKSGVRLTSKISEL